MRLHRWLVAGLALSIAANVAVAVVYLTKPRRAPRPDIYRMDRIDQFRQLATAEPDLVMLGDSLTDRGEWHELLPGRAVANRGIAGETLSGVMARLDTVVTSKPKSVAIMLGINDLLAGESVDTCLTRYSAVVDALQRVQPPPRIVVQSVLPVGRSVLASNDAIRLLNTQLRSLCTSRKCQFLDLFPAFVGDDGFIKSELTTDGVHLNGRGYVLWASLLK